MSASQHFSLSVYSDKPTNKCPQRDSNPCRRLERAVPWASRRWGLTRRAGTGATTGFVAESLTDRPLYEAGSFRRRIREPGRDRTYDTRIKSPLLYHLATGPGSARFYQ